MFEAVSVVEVWNYFRRLYSPRANMPNLLLIEFQTLKVLIWGRVSDNSSIEMLIDAVKSVIIASILSALVF